MSKADSSNDSNDTRLDEELSMMAPTSQRSNTTPKASPTQAAPPPPPPPPPPMNESPHLKRKDSGDSIKLFGIPRSLAYAASMSCSLNNSVITYDTDHVEDIRDLVLVDDDETTLASIRADPALMMINSGDPSISSSRAPPPNRNSYVLGQSHLHKTPVVRNSITDASIALDDSDTFMSKHNNAHHDRADFSPVRPMRGTSISSTDSENFKAAMAKQPYVYLHHPPNNSTGHSRRHSSNHNQQSFNSSIPSMWEDSWTTFATLDNSHHTTSVIHEEIEEDHSLGYADIIVDNAHAHSQPMTMPRRTSSMKSNNTSRKRSPRRTSSRNSQYSNFSSSTLDASAIRRTSRNQRISRLKRKSIQTANSSASSITSSPILSSSKHRDSVNSNATGDSQNSTKPQRRPTKILPRDEEAEAEPTTFFEHSASQLSLTSSEDEDDDSDFESDKTPQLPGRRTSVSSASLYEAEMAKMQLASVLDQPLSAPLRRTSTFGSTTLDPATVVECEDEEDYSSQDEEKHNNDNRYHVYDEEADESALPVSSIHLPPQQEGDNNAAPICSIHVPNEVDQVPTRPARQRSNSRRIEKEQWMRRESVESTGSSATDDYTPCMPKRQSTLTKPGPVRTLRNSTTSAACEKENKSNSEITDGTDPSSPTIPRPVTLPHRCVSDDAAPHPPARQASKASRCLSPVVMPMGSSSTLDGSSQSLSLTEKDGVHTKANKSEEDSNESILVTEKDSPEEKHNSDDSHPGDNNSKPNTAGVARAELYLQSSVTSCLSTATTQCAANKQREPERRMPPDRHFTRGSSLRSAAASLQKRDSNTSVHSHTTSAIQTAVIAEVEDSNLSDAKANMEDWEALNSVMAAENTPLSPTTELAQLKRMNEALAREMSPTIELATLKKMNAEVAPSSPHAELEELNRMNTAVAVRDTPLSPPTDLVQLNLPNESASSSAVSELLSPTSEFEKLKMLNEDTVQGLQKHLECLQLVSLEAKNEEEIKVQSASPEQGNNSANVINQKEGNLTSRVNGTDDTEGTMWTSVSKEFEHLKQMK